MMGGWLDQAQKFVDAMEIIEIEEGRRNRKMEKANG